jgi:hypothetical protein
MPSATGAFVVRFGVNGAAFSKAAAQSAGERDAQLHGEARTYRSLDR